MTSPVDPCEGLRRALDRPVDRRRLLRLQVEDATLVGEGYAIRLDLRLRGGTALGLGPVQLNRPRHLDCPVCPATVATLDAALEPHGDAEAAEPIDQAGPTQAAGPEACTSCHPAAIMEGKAVPAGSRPAGGTDRLAGLRPTRHSASGSPRHCGPCLIESG